MQRFSAVLVATVAVVALLNVAAAAEVAAAASSASASVVSTANAESLAFRQEAEAYATLAALPAKKVPADWSSEDSFMSAFVELEGDGMRKKSRAMAHKFVADLRTALKAVYPAAGALAAASKAKTAEFDKNFRAHCKRVAPSRKMCKNFVTILRLQFIGQNPFAEKNGNRKRFRHAVREIILRYVVAWRARYPKRSKRAGGNPWSPVALAAAAKAAGSAERADPMADVELSTGVRGGLNRYGRLNAAPHKSEPVLNIKPDGDYKLGSALDNPYDSAKPYKARKHVKLLREQVLDDLQYLRDKVYTKINDKKFHRMIGDPKRAPKAIRRTARLCQRLRSEHFFPPTFCRSLEYLASVNFVGRNFLRNVKDFSALLASFMDHNHKYTTRYGYRVHRKPNYRQDVTVVRTKLALKLRANRFNLRTFSREFVNMVSNVLAVPQSRIRIASVRLGGFHKLPGRRHTTVTFEFLPKKGDRRIRSRPARLDSVDSLAEQFRAMAVNRPGSDFYKVPILARILPKSMVLSKTLGRRPAAWAKRVNLQTKNVPRFAAVDQTLASDVAVTTEEVEADAEADTVADAETTEFEQSDAEYSDSDEALDVADTQSASELSAADEAEVAEAEAVAQNVADIEAHIEDTYAAAFEAQINHDAAHFIAGTDANAEAQTETEAETSADAAEADAEAEVAQQSEAEAEAETEAAEATGEVALLEVAAGDAVTTQTEALHLSADTMTDEEAEEEADAEAAEDAAELEAEDEEDAAEDAADADEVDAADAVDDEADDEAEDQAEDEQETETEEEADEAVDELVELSSAATLGADEEVESDAAWTAALLENSEQLVASSDADDSADEAEEDSADDEADADADAEADDELDADDEGAAFADSNAPIAPAESLAPLPEVNAVVEDAATEQKVIAAANSAKAAAASSVVAQALAAVDAEEAASETVFVETATKVTATQSFTLQSAASPRAAAAAFVPLLAAAVIAALKLW